jgi:hypothetical protein
MVLPQEANKSTEMIIVAVAEHEGVQLMWSNAQQIDIVVDRFSSEAEIHQQVPFLAPALRLRMQGQTELAD